MNKQKGIATRPSNRCRSRREERLPALLGGRSFERAASKTKSSRRLRSETPHRSAVLRQRINGSCKGKCRTLRVQQDQGRWLFPLHGQIKSRRRTPARGRGQAEIIRRPPQLGNRDKSAITLVASDTRILSYPSVPLGRSSGQIAAWLPGRTAALRSRVACLGGNDRIGLPYRRGRGRSYPL
jgi:hypothetical protein